MNNNNLQQRFQLIFDNLNDGILIATKDGGKFLLANQSICKILGYKLKEIQKMSIVDIHPKESLGFVIKQFKDLARGKKNLVKDVPLKHKNGQIIYVDINASLLDFDGRKCILGIFRDITESKEKETMLQNNERRYRITMQKTNQLVYEYFVDSGKIIWSGAIKEVTGYSEKEFNAVNIKKWEKMIHPDDRGGALKTLANAQKKLGEYNVQYRFCKKNNQYIFIEDRGVFIDDANGGAIKMLGVMQDITARKTIEDKLLIEKNKLQEYLDVADVILLSLDKNQRVININKKGCEILGYSEQYIIGKHWSSNFIPQKDALKVNEVFVNIVNGKIDKLSRFENSVLTKSGEERVIAWNNKIIKDNKGKFIFILSSGEDITEHKKWEQAISESEKKYSALVENSADAVIVLQGGIIKFANKNSEGMTGFRVDELVGSKFIDFVSPKYKKIVAENYKRRTAGEKVTNRYELEVLVKDDGYVPVEINASLLEFEGKPAVMAIIRDISRSKQIDRVKSEFISVASHQLRSPLTGIKWFSQLLADQKVGQLSEKQLDFIQQIYNSNERMIRLVNDLLDVSHIETGQKFSIEKKPGNIVALINNVINDQKISSPKKNITIEFNRGCPEKLIFNFDQDKVYQVFSNLINNSIKYSPQNKKIIIGVKCVGNEAQFFVKDFGFGIPRAQQNRIFQKFFRGDNIVTVSTEGTGLGLYIAKNIIEAHGGKIWFESKQDKGTTFYFTLPLKSKK